MPSEERRRLAELVRGPDLDPGARWSVNGGDRGGDPAEDPPLRSGQARPSRADERDAVEEEDENLQITLF
jgi:hypothetical protein